MSDFFTAADFNAVTWESRLVQADLYRIVEKANAKVSSLLEEHEKNIAERESFAKANDVLKAENEKLKKLLGEAVSELSYLTAIGIVDCSEIVTRIDNLMGRK